MPTRATPALPLDPAVAKQIESILTPLRQTRDQLLAERQELEQKLVSVRSNLRGIDRVLQAAEPKPSNGSKPTAKAGRVQTSNRVGEAKLAQLLGIIKKMPPDFTMGMVHAKVEGEMSLATVKNAIDMLREQGLVRRTGQPKIGRSRQYTHVFVPEGEKA